MKQGFKNRDVIKVQDFSKEDILHLLEAAQQIKKNPKPSLLDQKILVNCFYEPSTRTRLSFESAMLRLGGKVLGFADAATTSMKKGESLFDSIKMVENYADVIVLRHPMDGAAQHAAEAASIPVINAGDGSNQHPTQTFLDLYSIMESQGTLDGLRIGIAGDLQYARTIHSLVQALMHFKPRLYFIAANDLELPALICDELRNNSIKYSFHSSFDAIIPKLDVLYMTRIQAERISNRQDNAPMRSPLILTAEQLKQLRPSCACCIRCRGSMKSKWRWMPHRMLFTLSRLKTVFL